MTFSIRRGVNISHWLSQSEARGRKRQAWFRQPDMKRLRELGFDHVRLPIDEEQMYTESGSRENEAFDLLNAALDWAHESDMRVIIDLHILRSHYFQDESPPLFTDPVAANHLADVWRDLSNAFNSRPVTEVAYEILNEPAAPKNADWNRVSKIAYDAIRSKEANRVIVLGSNEANQAKTFDALEVPANDPNMVLSFHHYHPMPLTHYRAGWTKHQETYDGPVHYPGWSLTQEDLERVPPADRAHYEKVNESYDRTSIIAAFAKPLAVRERTGLQLHCGEFGCIKLAPEEPRKRWYRDMVAAFDELNIAWTAWDWRGSFAVVDEDGQPTVAYRGLFGE